MLTLEQGYEIVEAEGERGPWKCSTQWYQYSLNDAEGREIVAYHWHPAGESNVTRPHAHLGVGARVDHPQLLKAHLPTNRVSIEDFLLSAFAISAFNRCGTTGMRFSSQAAACSRIGRRGHGRVRYEPTPRLDRSFPFRPGRSLPFTKVGLMVCGGPALPPGCGRGAAPPKITSASRPPQHHPLEGA
jgi:hypothetical protein